MDWQSHYDSNDTPWDKSAPHPAILDFIAESGPFNGRILLPGCGRGHDVRAISTMENRVIGADIAPGAIAAARAIMPTGREDYILDDFFNLQPQLRASFHWLIEHTCFCAIDPAMRPAYAVAAADALKPGGHLLAIFYLNPETANEGHPPYGVTTAELDTLFTPFFSLVRQWTPAHTFAGRESREQIRLLRRIGK